MAGTLTRRDALALAPGAAALLAFGPAAAGVAEVEAAVAAFLGGATPAPAGLLTLPDVAENGNSVPVTLAVPGREDVAAAAIFAPGNPWPRVVAFAFSPLSGRAEATTRIRLARSQELVAVARMTDGTALIDRRAVEVTVGGCGADMPEPRS